MKTGGELFLPIVPDSSRIFFELLDNFKRMCYIDLAIGE